MSSAVQSSPGSVLPLPPYQPHTRRAKYSGVAPKDRQGSSRIYPLAFGQAHSISKDKSIDIQHVHS
jgi:hypothetical protein